MKKDFFKYFKGTVYWGFNVGPLFYKCFEFQSSRWVSSPLFGLKLEYRDIETDHSGIELEVTLFRKEYMFSFFDIRHADQR